MSRDVTNDFIAACNAQQTAECFIILVTIEHDDLDAPIRLNTSGQNQVSRGNTFLACPLQATLSDDSDDRPPQAKLVIDNVNRAMVQAVRSITTPPKVTLELVKASALDTVEAELTDFEMREVTYNALTVEGTLSLEGLFQESAISYSFTPSYFSGLF